MQTYLSVDRIENNLAVCELDDRTVQNIPLSHLPDNVQEGDILCLCNGEYIIDKQETMRRRNEALKLLKSLME